MSEQPNARFWEYANRGVLGLSWMGSGENLFGAPSDVCD